MSNGFINTFKQYNWEQIKERIYTATTREVEYILAKNKRTVEDFMSLLSPAAAPYLEQMAQMSQRITQKRFGKTIQLYAPMYLSN